MEGKLLLLLCCVMEENSYIPIEKLVVCAERLQLFKNIKDVAETREKVHFLVHQLIDASLLEAGDAEEAIRVTNYVCYACLPNQTS